MKPFKPFLLNWMLAGMFALGTALSGCYSNESDAGDATTLFRANLSGPQERPTPVITQAVAILNANYQPETGRLTYVVNWNGLTNNPTAMHFHGPATPEQVAPPVIPVTDFERRPGGQAKGTVTITAEQAKQLMNGLWYFNIHTARFPGGEVRGQIMMGK